jgi:hypothetical protein
MELYHGIPGRITGGAQRILQKRKVLGLIQVNAGRIGMFPIGDPNQDYGFRRFASHVRSSSELQQR